MNEVHRDTLVEFLKNRKACDLCLKEKCSKRCKHARNYTYGYMEKMYDKAIEAAGNDVATAKSEARKEFAERLKEKGTSPELDEGKYYNDYDIDRTLKEMESEQE